MFDRLSRFVHRPAEKDTYDSICTVCLATVARGMSQEKLEELERHHACNREKIARLAGSLKRP